MTNNDCIHEVRKMPDGSERCIWCLELDKGDPWAKDREVAKADAKLALTPLRPTW